MTTKTIHQVGEMVGIPAKETDVILLEIRANQKLLDECEKPHDFSICLDRRTKQPIENPTPQQHFGARWRCSKCGGHIDSINRSWYNKGLKDGGSGWYCGRCEKWMPESEKGFSHTDGVCYCSENCAEERDANR